MVKPCLQKILSNKECYEHDDCVHTILADYWFYQFNLYILGVQIYIVLDCTLIQKKLICY